MKWVLAMLAVMSCVTASATPQENAAKGVLQRLIGKRAAQFSFKQIDSTEGRDRYTVSASQGKVQVVGTTAVAMCRGAYDYLKDYCHCLVTWDGDQLALPTTFPDAQLDSGPNPNIYRHYFNVCTFGYTTAFWDWKRWQREIDWMALHGINMPLSMNGLEKVWQTVWRQYGLTDAQIRAHFVGPAFRPWQWMGNVDSHGGPMPQDWIDRQAALQQKILNREFELGMKPVTPAFASFIPAAFAAKLDPNQVRRSSGWCYFEPTYMLDPRNPLFEEIGTKFIQAYKKQFGRTAGLYLADIYNEMSPQVKEDTKLQELREIAQAVHRTIKSGDPKGTWVMQGWLFFNERNFWKDPEVEAYLDGVPDQDMVLLDLASEAYEVWRVHAAFRKKPYIWNMLHNYGQNTVLSGDLRNIATKPIAALNDPNHGQMAGMGITMEGIEQNAVMYELMTDMMWRKTAVDPEKWIEQYGVNRYGLDSPEVRKAWRETIGDIYLGKVQTEAAAYTRRPSMDQLGEPGDEATDCRSRIKALLALPTMLHQSPLWRRDVVDIAKRYGDFAVRGAMANVVEKIESKDNAKIQGARAQFDALMSALDSLLSVVPEHRMSRWIEMARSTVGKTDQDLLERNARLQVTVWGGPILYDYAAKEWSGLVWDYYRPRWDHYFDGLEAGKEVTDLPQWELEWCGRTDLPNPRWVSVESGVEELLRRGEEFETSSVDRGIAVGKPVTSDGGTEGSSVPNIITDGRSSGRYWAAGPGPHWVQIDLEKPVEISRVQVFPYVDGSRYYQYTVSVSGDGQNWTQVADFSKNKLASPRRGFTHEFSSQSARYVRVAMTYNSANPSMHLYEVRVFVK
ncbi:MAG: alpha-N-acetylglucosaminidase C-terminal domain-containing protein [Armatimonadetes bacterium]|nr:alpha-N-acetylglucosaminidase C-terminal domain-containing protein [Armatimonadota bacterium]